MLITFYLLSSEFVYGLNNQTDLIKEFILQVRQVIKAFAVP
jgi:hypothetical protein